ncbi:DUF6443 domain-containing protein [Reichenbachiella sp.]|uniref:DUF6443 domain-containing protein n=1 Tax=Reichenbachiella sp. TaxID=2184521 RepID=UPI003B59A59B
MNTKYMSFMKCAETMFSGRFYNGLANVLMLFFILTTFSVSAQIADTGKPAKASTTFTITKDCGKAILKANSNPSMPGVEWFWQNAKTDENRSYSAKDGKTFNAYIAKAYYLRAYNGGADEGDKWSDESLKVTVESSNITPKPTIPSVPIVSNDCLAEVTLTRSTPPDGVIWYWQSEEDGKSTGDARESVKRSTGFKYYLRAKHETENCWSDQSTFATYNINGKPPTPSSSLIKKVENQAGATKFTRHSNEFTEQYEVYWQETADGEETGGDHKADNYTVSSGSIIYLRAKQKTSQCWSDAYSRGFEIVYPPQTPKINNVKITEHCGVVRITQLVDAPDGETWYWQNSPIRGEETTNHDEPIRELTTKDEISSGGEIYLKSQNDQFKFWSGALTIPYKIEDIPEAPATQPVAICASQSAEINIASEQNHEIHWYSNDNESSDSFHSGNDYQTPELLVDKTYYVSQYNTVTECESSRNPVLVRVEDKSEGGTITGNSKGFGSVHGTLLLTGANGDLLWQKRQDTEWLDIGNDDVTQSYSEYEDTDWRVRAIYRYCPTEYSNIVTNKVYPVPEIISIGGSVPDYNEDIQLESRLKVYDSYQWMLDGEDLVGETQAVYSTSVPGSYQIRVTLEGKEEISDARIVSSAVVAEDQSEVRSYMVTSEGISNWDDLELASSNEYRESIQYLDGLGRPIQEVIKKGSPGSFDIVKPIEYNSLGQQRKDRLTYVVEPEYGSSDGSFKTEMLVDHDRYYNSHFNDNSGDFAYSETEFEPSPLNRPVKTYAPGQTWSKSYGNKPMTYDYQVNAVNEVVRWELEDNELKQLSSYAPGTLNKTVTTDENGNQLQEFKDLQGRVVLKKVQESAGEPVDDKDWLETYYIYDDFGNLRFVLPPEAIRLSK